MVLPRLRAGGATVRDADPTPGNTAGRGVSFIISVTIFSWRAGKTSCDQLLAEVRGCNAQRRCRWGRASAARGNGRADSPIVGQAPGTRVRHRDTVERSEQRPLRGGLQWIAIRFTTNAVRHHPDGLLLSGPGPARRRSAPAPSAPLWHARLLELLPDIGLTLLVGQYAQRYYLGDRACKTLSTLARRGDYGRNTCHCRTPRRAMCCGQAPPVVRAEVVPELRVRVQALLGD